MNASSDDDREPQEMEVLGPGSSESVETPLAGDNILALISNYTERPDLLIDAIEKHDPGFIARMNKSAEESSDRMQSARFRFGEIQAYTSLAVSVVAALVVLFLLYVLVSNDQFSFWSILGLTCFYAVSQSGLSGFASLGKAIGDAVRAFAGRDGKD